MSRFQSITSFGSWVGLTTGCGCSTAQLENMIKQADRSGRDAISLADFVRLMRKKGKGLVGCEVTVQLTLTAAESTAALEA